MGSASVIYTPIYVPVSSICQFDLTAEYLVLLGLDLAASAAG